KRIVRVADALHEHLRNPQPVGLYRREAGEGRQAGNGGKSKSRGTQLAEVVQPAEVDGEIRIQRQLIETGAECDAMRALHPGGVVRPLVALLYAIHKRERLAPEESHPGN